MPRKVRFYSILLRISPILGVWKQAKRDRRQESIRRSQEIMAENSSWRLQAGSGNSLIPIHDQIAGLAKLRDDGILTEEEFTRKKKQLLDKIQ